MQHSPWIEIMDKAGVQDFLAVIENLLSKTLQLKVSWDGNTILGRYKKSPCWH